MQRSKVEFKKNKRKKKLDVQQNRQIHEENSKKNVIITLKKNV